MLKKIMLLPLLAFSFAIAQPVFAKAEESVPSCTCQRMDKMAKTLELDEAQLAQIKAIKTKSKESMIANRQQLKSIKIQIKNLIIAKKLDESQLDSLISQKTTLLAAMIKSRIMAKNQIYNLLNTKQQLKFQEMMKKWDTIQKHTSKKCKCPAHSA